MKLEIPYLTYSDIGERAQVFLTEYHPLFEIPIPIEQIVDVKLGLDIVSIPNLYMDFGLIFQMKLLHTLKSIPL